MTQNTKVGPKDFFLWAGAMVSFYVAVGSFITLVFDYIDTVFPDVLNYNYDPYSSGIRFAIASVVVLFPLYLLLMWLIRRDINRTPGKSDFWVRRWALVLTIFVAGVSIATDLIVLINYYLGGDITMHFILKVLVVLLVAGAGLLHFLADLRGYWIKNPRYVRSVGWAVSVLVAVTIISGFFIIGSPNTIRLYRFDDQKVSDLQNIQWQIVNYWQTKEKLPASLTDLNDPISNFTVPVDSQTGVAYEYIKSKITWDGDPGPLSFQLCATFNADTQANSPTASRGIMTAPIKAPVPMGGTPTGEDLQADSWYHTTGHHCFDRKIDPQRYPPFSKTKQM